MVRSDFRAIPVVLAVVSLVFAVGSAQAQTPLGNRLGFFGGLNIANESGDLDVLSADLAVLLADEFGGDWASETGSIQGLGFGAYLLIQRSPTFGVQIEAQYIQRGAKIDFTGNVMSESVTAETEFQLDYLEIPLLARFSPSPGANFRPLLVVGPVIGFKTGANMEMTIEGQSASVDISDGYKSTVFGLLGGVGFTAGLGQSTHLVVQGRYYLGLTNAIDDDTYSVKASDLGFFAGLEFALGK
jgi:hypothetical protein